MTGHIWTQGESNKNGISMYVVHTGIFYCTLHRWNQFNFNVEEVLEFPKSLQLWLASCTFSFIEGV